MKEDFEMESRLWEYIDGISSPDEQKLIRQLLGTDAAWQKKHAELTGLSDLIMKEDLDVPSMRFTRNVMEQIALLHVSPASREYINKNVIRGLSAFFGLLITGFLIYAMAQVHWSSAPTDSIVPKLNLDVDKVVWGKGLNNTYINAFLLINVVVGLFVLDRFLHQRRRDDRQQTAGSGF